MQILHCAKLSKNLRTGLYTRENLFCWGNYFRTQAEGGPPGS